MQDCKFEMKINVIFPHPPGDIGGPSTFQHHIQNYLIASDQSYTFYPEISNSHRNIIFVVGGTRRILWLLRKKINGFPILLRLDGKNYDVSPLTDGLLHWAKAKLVDMTVELIRILLADHVVYQSRFVESVWEKPWGKSIKKSVIYNGASLIKNNKEKDGSVPQVICVEGCIQGPSAGPILAALKHWEISVYGRFSEDVCNTLGNDQHGQITFYGPVSHAEILERFQQKVILLNLETNPACPNSVVEALCNGVPVLGFDSGCLKELVGDAGIILPYGGNDRLKRSAPVTSLLENALEEITANYYWFSSQAIRRSRQMFAVGDMNQAYRKVLERL